MQFGGKSNRSFSLDRLVYAVLMICIALVFITERFYWGLLFLLVTLPYFVRQSGVQFKEKLYFEYTSIFGLKFGKWRTTPPVLYILIKDTQFITQRSTTRSKVTNMVSETYEVALVCEGRTKIILLYTTDVQDAIKKVNSALVYFKCDLRDMTHEQLMQNPEANW